MTNQIIKDIFLSDLSAASIDYLRAKRRFLKMGRIILFMSLHSSYCMEYGPSTSETPVNYYQCISGACSEIKPNFRGLKSKYDLNMTPVKNQNPLGTCTTFTVGSCVEYSSLQYNGAGNLTYFPVSEAEFTVYAEQHTPGGNCKQGLNLGEAFKVAKGRGFIHEDYWPYSDYIEEVRALNGLKEDDEIGSLADICITNKYTKRQLNNIPKVKLNDVKVISHISRQSILTAFSKEIQRAPIKRSNSSLPLSFESPHPNSYNIIPTIKAYIQNHKAPVAISVATFESWGNAAYINMPSLKVAQQWNNLHSKKDAEVFSRSYYSDPSSNISIRDSSDYYPYGYEDSDDSFLTFTPNGWHNNSKNRYSTYPFSSSSTPRSIMYDDLYAAPTFLQPTLSQNLGLEAYKEGWHAIVLTGFDDDMNAFKFKNSWGKKWGEEGYGWLPYEYVKLYTSELVAAF